MAKEKVEPTDILNTYSMEKLRSRSVTFRWLRNHYNTIAGMLEIRKAEDSRRPIWPNFANMARREGLTLSRDALRRAWPVVQEEWDKTDPSLRAPLPAENEILLGEPRSKGASAASGTEFFSPAKTPGNPASSELDFLIPDITGKKIR